MPTKFGQSVKYAFRGVKYAAKHERNFRIELVFAVIVIAAMLFFDLRSWESIMLIIMIAWVLLIELVNTIVERVVDILRPRIHPYARLIKDMMAAVVLLSALVSAVIGIIIFYPHIQEFIKQFI